MFIMDRMPQDGGMCVYLCAVNVSVYIFGIN